MNIKTSGLASIFLIESPLQLFNAIEAKFFFNLKNCKLVIVYSQNEHANEQINKLLNFHPDWMEVNKIFPSSRKRFKILTVKEIINQLNIFNKEKFNYVLIGDYRPDFMLNFCNSVICSKLVVLDDGTATIDIMKDYLQKNNNTNIKKNLKKLLFGFRLLNNNDVLFFTVFKNINLKNKIINNRYSYFNSLINNLKVNKNSVIFLGSKIVEINAISQDKYLMYLSDFKKKIGEKKIIYLPHRGERNDKLKMIEKKLNFNIVRTNSIIEFYLIENNELPFAVTGFFSSALLNLRILFDDKIKILSFHIKNKDFDDLYAVRFENMYKYYRDNNIEVIDKY